jgi:hypothetical protein
MSMKNSNDTIWDRTSELLDAWLSRRIKKIKVVRLSALRAGRIYPQEIILVLISVRGCFDPKTVVWSEEYINGKIQ